MAINALCSCICWCCIDSEEEEERLEFVTNRYPQTSYESCSSSDSSIAMPTLDINYMNSLSASLYTDESLQEQLCSQGFHTSHDGTYTYSHESSVPLSRFKEKHLPCAINMDRGGVVRRPDGSHAGCIADGVSSGGCLSTFVAHIISQYFLNKYSKHTIPFTDNDVTNDQLAKTIFTECAQAIYKLIPSHQTGGASTALFAECVLQNSLSEKRIYNVQVMALGDCAALHVNTTSQTITQLNTIHREFTSSGKPNPEDSGGCIRSNGKIRSIENVVTSITQATEDDYIVLVTDGFLDNVRDGKIVETVQLVAFTSFFDQPVEKLVRYVRPWEGYSVSALPTLTELAQFITQNSKDSVQSITKPTAEEITRRLSSYVKLTTYYHCHLYNTHQKPKYIIDRTPKPDDCMIITFSPGTS